MLVKKKGVSLVGLKLPMREVLRQTARVFENIQARCVVTSGTEGIHSWGSLHYYGYALDFRTRHLNRAQKDYIVKILKVGLGKHYLVLLEKDHLHIQYQVAKRMVSDLEAHLGIL